MIYTFIKNNEKIFPIEKGVRYYKSDEEAIMIGKASVFQTENKELSLLKKK